MMGTGLPGLIRNGETGDQFGEHEVGRFVRLVDVHGYRGESLAAMRRPRQRSSVLSTPKSSGPSDTKAMTRARG